jgi:F0F1-type ATP synthase assembly protein I
MKPLRLRGMSLAYVTCAAQLGIGLAAALIGYGHSGKEAAGAALFGALAAAIPGLYFAAKVFRGGRNERPLEVLGAVYVGEAGKFVLAVLLFILGAKLFPAHFLALMLTFMACLSVYWLMLALSR